MSSALEGPKLERAFIERAVDDALIQRLEQLNDIGTSLSAERDINRLLETISPPRRRSSAPTGARCTA
jgi:hypothetical protein